MNIYSCLFFDYIEKVAKFLYIKKKAPSKRLIIYVPPPSGLLLSQKVHLIGMLQI